MVTIMDPVYLLYL